jgi:hypothetical protein
MPSRQVYGMSTDDIPAIRQTALDYIEGFYDGDAARMERSLHSELAKRIAHPDPVSGRSHLAEMSALALIGFTRDKAARPTPKEQQQKDITVFEVTGNAASARIVASTWVDYLHLSKFNGRWVIVNVLWEMKPGETFAPYW